MQSRRLLALVSLTILMIVWGSTFLVTKQAVDEVPPLTLGALRYLIAAGALALIAIPQGRRALLRPPLTLGQLVALSVSGASLFIIALNYALLWGSVTQAALIYALTPAAVALGAVFGLKERLSRTRLIGIVLSVAGVVVVVASGGKTADAPHPLLAAIAMLVVVAAWAAYTIIAKRVAGADQVVLMTWVVGAGAVTLLPFAGYEIAQVGWPAISVRGWAGVIFLGVIASGVAYLVYNWTLRHLEASVVGALTNLDPVVGVLSAVVFLGEVLNGWQIVGGIGALAGMWLASKRGTQGDAG
jgi:drug/metabolite transporter (DMT)-like permease